MPIQIKLKISFLFFLKSRDFELEQPGTIMIGHATHKKTKKNNKKQKKNNIITLSKHFLTQYLFSGIGIKGVGVNAKCNEFYIRRGGGCFCPTLVSGFAPLRIWRFLLL